MIETNVRILNTGTFVGCIEIIIDGNKFILKENEFIDFFAKVDCVANQRAMNLMKKERKDCDGCELWGECDHQGAYYDKNNKKWCYE